MILLKILCLCCLLPLHWQFSGAAGTGWNFQHETGLYYRPDAVSRYHYDAESRYQEVLFADDNTSGTYLLFDNADNLLYA